MSAEDRVPFPYRIGRVARPHGVRGEVLVQMFRRRPHAVEKGGLATRRLRAPLPVELEHVDGRVEPGRVLQARWVDPQRVVLRLDGLEDRDEAQARVGCYLDVEPEQLTPELHDAVDACFEARVLDADSGERLGRVEAISDNGAQPLLEIELAGGGDALVLVPAVPEIVVEVGADGAGRFVRIRPIPGLLEVER